MTLHEIREMPVTVDATGLTHESVMRSFHIVEKIVELLAVKTPHCVILEIIADLLGRDHGPAITFTMGDLIDPRETEPTGVRPMSEWSPT